MNGQYEMTDGPGVNWARAFVAGVLGGTFMSAVVMIGGALDLTDFSIEWIWATLLVRDLGGNTWLFGFLIHLTASGLVGLLYGLLLHSSGNSDAARGALIAIPHLVLAGILMLIIPFVHPAIPGILPAPGFLGVNHGILTMGLVVAGHLVYGAVAGSVYSVESVELSEG